jgi:hypothetical protein
MLDNRNDLFRCEEVLTAIWPVKDVMKNRMKTPKPAVTTLPGPFLGDALVLH